MIRLTTGDKIMYGFFYLFVGAFALFCLYPFLLVVATSFTSEISVALNGYRLIPRDFSLEAYRFAFATNRIWDAYKITIFVTVVGTTMNMIITILTAYPLSVRTLKYRNHLAFYFYFTMLFGGGLVANYILNTRYLGLLNSIWVLILPGLMTTWYMFLMRNFFRAIPTDFAESAKIDGAGEITILWKIILPLSLPSIATISLFYALDQWNTWFAVLLYIHDTRLFTLQYLIMSIIREANFAATIAAETGIVMVETGPLPQITVRMSTLVLATGPIIFIYPFIQKYFVKGLTVGGIKG
jgi:multiple sugar transport system permease protein/putative aldouronate transport system permease protein